MMISIVNRYSSINNKFGAKLSAPSHIIAQNEVAVWFSMRNQLKGTSDRLFQVNVIVDCVLNC